MILFNQYKLSSYLKVTSVFFLLSVIISYNLWTNDRTFPVFPITEEFSIPNYLIEVLKYLLIGLLVTLTYTVKRNLIRTIFVCLSLLVIADQMRLQPWVYFYFLILLPFAISNSKEQTINYLRFLFIIVYLWSGIHKLNPNFSNLIFESILIDGFGITNPSTLSSIKLYAFIIPFVEITTGIFLLFYSTRKYGAYLAILSHLLILYYLIFGLKGNWVIVPWNVFMILSIIYLFIARNEKVLLRIQNKALVGVLVFVFLLPIGFYSGHVDQRLSFSLYDGQLKSLYEFNSGSDTHYETLQNHIEKGSITDYTVWSFKELEVPFYPEERFIKRLQQQTSDGTLVVTDLPLWERNIKGVFKTKQELTNYNKVFSLGNVKFDTIVYFPNYRILE